MGQELLWLAEPKGEKGWEGEEWEHAVVRGYCLRGALPATNTRYARGDRSQLLLSLGGREPLKLLQAEPPAEAS